MRDPQTSRQYTGQCHCGAVQFSIHSNLAEFTTCDCSLCAMRGALMVKVPEADLKIDQGKDALTLYQWNMKIARHYFCKSCGIYVLHNKRAAPDHYGVNVRTLMGVADTDAPHRATKGDDMSVAAQGAQDHWPGPRVITNGKKP
ncbi:GFA family protein [Fretibacter rubidus]|uniref:GFA family protein n=1 Tax=Fretibacter rubidus TaxID=570162 RepID=UPI00352B515C